MANYLYLDGYGILHAVEKNSTANQASNSGKVLKMDCDSLGGFPVVNGQKIFAYSPIKVYVGGNVESGKPLAKCDQSMQKSVEAFMAKIVKLWG